MTTPIKYVALLRGINMIGRKVVSMTELARWFSSLAFENVKTLLATGNVIFEHTDSCEGALVTKIEAKLARNLGYQVRVLLRTISDFERLVEFDPFRNERVDNKRAKAFVTFVDGTPKLKMKLPFTRKGEFKIVGVGPREVFSVRYALGDGRFGDSVTFIEREVGLPTTSRNYSTVAKLALLKQ